MVYQLRWRGRSGSNSRTNIADDAGWDLRFDYDTNEAATLSDALDRYLINSSSRYASGYDYEIRERDSETVVWRGHVAVAGVPVEGTWYDGSPCPGSGPVAVLVPYKRAFGARYRAAR